MADRVDISAIARVVDQASGPLRSIEQAIGKTGQAARTASASVARLGSAGLFGGMMANLRGVGAAASRLGGQIKGFLGPILGLAGVAGIGGAIAAMKDYISTTAQLGKTSSRLGLAPQALAGFRYAAGNAELADDALSKLQKTLATVSAGGKAVASTASLLGKFGVGAKQIKEGNLEEILPAIAQGFQKNTNPILRARMAMALFGKSGQQLIPFLAKGRDGIAALVEEARNLGLLPTNEMVDQAKEANKAFGDMHQALTGVRNVVAAALLPVITPLVEQFKNWVVTNREWLKVNITGAINSIADAIKSINWTAVLAGFQKFGQWLEWGVQLIGGWENAFIAFIALMNGSLIASLLNVGLVLAQLAAAVLTNPIGLAIVAIALAAYLIYQHWDGIVAFFAGLWGGVKAAFWATLDWLREFGDRFAFGAFTDDWAPLAAHFVELWDNTKAAFWHAADWLGEFAGRFLPQPMLDAWEPLKGFFRDLWADVLGLFETAKQAIKSAVDWIVAAVQPLVGVISTVTGAIGAVGGAVGAVGQGVARAASGALDYGRGLIGAAPSATPNGANGGVAAAAGPNLLQQQAAVTAAAPPQRSEIEQRLKVDLSPELRASLTNERTSGAPVRSEVEIGRSMAPAWGAA